MKRGDSLHHKLLRAHEPYILTGTASATFEGLVASGQIDGELTEAEPRPITTDSKRVLVFFMGETGDAAATKPAIAASHYRLRLDFVTAQGDECLLDSFATFQYPITLRQAAVYDAWIEFDARARIKADITDAFGAAIGLVPADIAESSLAPGHVGLDNPVQSMCDDTGRPKVAIRIYSDSHYRSWQTYNAMITMTELATAGYDCYVIGDAKQRIIFVDGEGGPEVRLWNHPNHPGIYDASGLFATVDEQVAFLRGMDVVIAPDGGVLQIACALRKPTLGLFGPTLGASRAKYAPTLSWIDGQTPDQCAPCWCGGDRPPCSVKWCHAIGGIEPLKIVEQVDEMLVKDAVKGAVT